MHVYNLSTRETEAGRCQVSCQPEMHNEFNSSARGILCLRMALDLTSVIFPHVFYTTIFLNYEKSPEFRGMTAVRVPASRVLDGNTVSSRQRERPHR